MKPKTEGFSRKIALFPALFIQKPQIFQPEMCIAPICLHFQGSKPASPRPRTLKQGGEILFLPMKPKTPRFSPESTLFFWALFIQNPQDFPPQSAFRSFKGRYLLHPDIGTHETQNRRIFHQKCTSVSTFHPKTANYPTTNMCSAHLPAFLRANAHFTATGDLVIKGWGPNPTHENQNRQISPKKCTSHPKNHKFSNQKTAFRPSAPTFNRHHLLYRDRRHPKRGVQSQFYP